MSRWCRQRTFLESSHRSTTSASQTRFLRAMASDNSLGALGVQLSNPHDVETGLISQMRESAFQADRQKLLSQRAALEQDIQDAQRSLDSTMQEMNSISKSSRMDSVHANALNRLTVQRNSLQRRIDFSHSKIQRLNGRIQQLTTEYQREPQTQSNRTVDLLMGDVDNERDRLIRLGEITPFQQMSESSASNHNRHSSTLNAPIPTSVATAPMVGLTGTKRSYAKFAIADDTDNVAYAARMRSTRHQPVAPSVKPEKKHKLGQSGQSRAEAISIDSDKSDSDSSSDSSDESSDESSDAISDESSGESESRRRPVKSESYQFDSESDSQSESSSSLLRSPEDSEVDEASANDDDASDDEAPDIQLDGGLAVPARVHERLFKYQRTGIRWLWELHQQNVGGIIADEMGLGKTVQIVSFLAALHRSNKLRASVIVCPASVMHQWLREFRAWYPSFRVMIMHDSGNHSLTPAALLERVFSDPFAQTRGAVVITTYESVRINEDLFCAHEWGYLVLDEGHKIRNPDAAVTLACKKFLTTHRIIMSGAPIQNNLRELWSLFDFCFPGKLGTLPVFEEEFCTPITLGGYRNASALQVQLAYKCALMLRDIIHPYILRRVKADIRFHLPEKTEQILFCRLSHAQRAEYKRRLASRDVVDAMAARAEGRSIGRSAALRAIDTLRKLCNHPDLLLRESSDRPVDYGNAERSGKLQVVGAVLRAWKAEGHRVLLFAQTRQMLDIIEQYVRQADYEYRRFDGSTSIRARQPMIDEFNTDPNIFLFLLTTRAGGLGVNLTGADRIILFDPDWNPSTDAQARERAYRIGQTKNVVIYRLVTKGTIEEKVYHRQIFKQMLTDRVLKDAQQRRLFSSAEMRDLFSLDDDAPAASGKSHSETHELMQEMQDMTQARQRMVGELEEGEIRPPVEFEITQMPTSTGAESNSGTTKSENKFLDVLFANEQALSGVLSHDQLMEHAHDGGRASAAVLTSKAAQIADKALHALKQSQQALQGSSVGEPTWTGRHGTSGQSSHLQAEAAQIASSVISSARPRFGAVVRDPGPASSSPVAASAAASEYYQTGSDRPFGRSVPGHAVAQNSTDSRSLLNTLRARSSAVAASAPAMPSPSPTSPPSASLSSHEQLLLDLRAYIRRHMPQGAPSDALIAAFEPRCRTQAQQFVFRELLRKIATFTSSNRRWTLKAEFSQ